ncbi:D-alanyl-D-alanine carboxypeptidase/D-alanyl-D-alanine-endopeptidase (penicillin-binding protein 4) [Luteococcus japonicus]|uniref:D-alanyl-D-alanine carboxypeptidase/D-alanyl-D-alanine-endopeptidase (Penicillin-binding protein 4) n=1 Tax=Luteococcus japonicus TaxID=33984 RepID=A0A3N1ZU11_9ACTN|nr:D-alanyl-D-alanine carboxypeptidase/D-alanyl-D-alanine-endopeptidase [Luteococcus japonicus]ROR54329.1 D-alanyl-D-alanine carboxypeptidase/D-alanyl-D-alanine-endopeptidase (penicillin-binding protein 4) [Luteococcus japonicus]
MLTALLAIAGAVCWRPALYATGLWVDGGQPTVSQTLFEDPSASPSASQPARGSGVIASAPVATPTHTPDPKALAAALAKVPAKDMGTTSGVVLDAVSGELLWSSRPDAGQIPASTLKLLTCLTALDVLGPDKTFSTRVVQQGKGIVLVGGGDPYLASKPAKEYPFPATSADLAKKTAAALKKQGMSSVTLGYDESLFSGPNWHPSWPQGYHDQVTNLSALWIDKGKPDEKSAPSQTPAPTAATVFAAQLKANGITVSGKPTAAAAGADAAEVASVQSLPVSSLVQETLVHSDNAAAEVLLRQVGVATGNGGSFTGGAKGMQQRLTTLKAWDASTRIADGSGLSRNNRVSARVLGRALHLAAASPKLRPLLEGLPSAGVTGTLHLRFYTPASEPGRGWVNAKTGTLSKVSTLAGYTRTRQGGEVVFAFMSNNPKQEWNVRSWLDQMASTLVTCGC